MSARTTTTDYTAGVRTGQPAETRAARRRASAALPAPLASLFLASAIAAGIVVLANLAVVALRLDAAAVRELELFLNILGRPGWPQSDAAGRFFAWILPAVLNRSFALHDVGGLLAFVGLALASTLFVYWMLAALAAPFVWAAARLLAPARHRYASWFWGRGFPLLVLCAFSLPAIRGVVRMLMTDAEPFARSSVTFAIGLTLWLGLVWALGDSARVQRALRWSFAATLAASLVIWAGAAVALGRGGYFHQQPPPAAGLPNVLLVSIDSLRSDHLHSYGYKRETSPTIDSLAADGARFKTVVSPTSWTLPAHLTLLTSLPPEEHGVTDDETRLREDAVFLSEVLWDKGYTTAGFVSGPYLNAAYGFAQGWDHYDDYTVAKVSHLSAWRGVTSPPLYDVVSNWLGGWDSAGRQRPFFMFVHMWDVHYDFTPPPPYDTMFDPDYRGSVTGEDFELGDQVHLGMDPRDLEHVIALYDGEIRFTDLYLGKIIDRLRALGVLDNTIVVVTADHGEEFFEHGRKGHKKALYDESILVPLVIRFPPAVPAGRVVEPQVRLMDIAPTILSLAGLHKPDDFGTGRAKGYTAPQDLRRWIAGDGALPPLLAFSDLKGEAPVPIAAVRAEDSKLIRELDGAHKEELYDLTTDRHEQVNLLRDDAVLETPLRQELSGWRDNLQSGGKMAQTFELNEGQKERLRALGYLK
jgi:arylsulfatase A-like enzyme